MVWESSFVRSFPSKSRWIKICLHVEKFIVFMSDIKVKKPVKELCHCHKLKFSNPLPP